MGGALRLVALAEIARPHGVRGELRLKVYNATSDLLARRPPVTLRLPDGEERPARLVAVRPTNAALLVRLEGVDDRDAAEALRGASVLVDRALFPPLEDGEFYACDVEGARVVLDGADVGRVRELVTYPTCNALVVERPDGARLEVPLVEPYVESVDTASCVVTLGTLDGL